MTNMDPTGNDNYRGTRTDNLAKYNRHHYSRSCSCSFSSGLGVSIKRGLG